MSLVFSYKEDFLLESGKVIQGFHLTYTTWGHLNQEKDNVIWVFHALTANSNPAEWWPGLVGPDAFLNTDKYFIICVNMPGSCYGSVSPLSTNPQTGEPYYHQFPLFTTRDMIRSYQLLQKSLGISKVFLGIGGSMGGQQLLEWAVEDPFLFENIVPIATNAFHSPWGIAFNATQRQCIEADPTWQQQSDTAGIEGMKVARSIALLSYRHYDTYNQSQAGYTAESAGKPVDEQVARAQTYQQYQGEKLARRFNAFSYYNLSKAMDTHNVGRNRTSAQQALQRVKANTLVIGINSDILFPPAEQAFVAQHIPGAQLEIIDSLYGHDGFLLEYDVITRLITNFLQQHLQQSHTVTATQALIN
ncbi:homoserine O-acetyltransferase [Filimonas lacunae]|uniref:Homoserine O-acetyltransferase n=1 Tax=Filimonas lacunae TaxID=477680 RepID=A0A173MN50_9BACT|nr:homoserine O-acetyltransferase [Filimonas lacunae]BAV08808.1 homoserine O-acetyltransferase [Filimonas lacunae]SIS62084.1 homoserine O-acetyltransferase [Filimonas lacunae]